MWNFIKSFQVTLSSQKKVNCEISLFHLPFLLRQQLQSLTPSSKNPIFTFTEATILFFLSALKKSLSSDRLADEFILIFLQIKNFIQKSLPYIFPQFIHSFEIFFVFEFLVKNYSKISKKKIPMLAQSLFEEGTEKGLGYFEGKAGKEKDFSELNQNEISRIINLKSNFAEGLDVSGSFISTNSQIKGKRSRFSLKSKFFITICSTFLNNFTPLKLKKQ